MRIARWLNDFRNRGVLAALGFTLLIVLFTVSHHAPKPSKIQTHFGTQTAPASLLASPTGSASAPSGSSAVTTAPGTPKNTVTAIETPVPPSPSVIAARQLNVAGSNLLKTIVNIVCLSGDKSIPSISGTGVIIDSRGIILTAAHVAQLFLLQDYLGTNKVQCLIRTGSPARRAYLAEPIYVSPLWVAQNPGTLTTSSPEGTGENDFALLAITATATSTPLPSSYPAISLSPEDPSIQEPVAISSYGAQYLTPTQLNYSLYPILVFGSIQKRYTYDKNTVDLVSIEGSAASQEGSSGGGIANANSQLVGTITTSSIAGNIGTRFLNAITINHMRRSFKADTGQNLDAVLQNQSLPSLIASFANESKQLGQLLDKGL
jgi:hypothetical protein